MDASHGRFRRLAAGRWCHGRAWSSVRTLQHHPVNIPTPQCTARLGIAPSRRHPNDAAKAGSGGIWEALGERLVGRVTAHAYTCSLRPEMSGGKRHVPAGKVAVRNMEFARANRFTGECGQSRRRLSLLNGEHEVYGLRQQKE